MSRALLGSALLATVVGCSAPPDASAPLERAASDLSLEDLPDTVRGTLSGEAFAAESAWFRVHRFAGRERVDLYFDAPAPARCGLPIRREGRRVWLRFPGRTDLPEGETRGSTGVSGRDDEVPVPVTVHHEGGAGATWNGHAGGIVAWRIDRRAERAVEGRLSVCFDDGEGSCVAGRFRAPECFTRIDGRVFREGVGLISGEAPPDEAAEDDGTP